MHIGHIRIVLVFKIMNCHSLKSSGLACIISLATTINNTLGMIIMLVSVAVLMIMTTMATIVPMTLVAMMMVMIMIVDCWLW